MGCQKFDFLTPLGIPEQPFQLFYHIIPESHQYIEEWLKKENLFEQKFVVFAPSGPTAKKKWGNSCFATLGDLIWEYYQLPIVLVGAKNEHTDCTAIFEMMKHKPYIAPDTDWNRLVALLPKAELLICNDSGINHVSCATETKTIAIFGPTDPIRWSPASVFTHHHHLYNPDYIEGDDSFGITPKEVMEKIKEIGIL